MLKKTIMVFVCSLILSTPQNLYSQNNTDDSILVRLIRIEAKLDTLLHSKKYTKLPYDDSKIIKDDSNLLYGIKGKIGTLLDKEYFVINHNDALHIPRWVAYYLSSSLLDGTQGRTDDFRSDKQLPKESQAQLSDYRRSGYDRGHNAPAGAFKRGFDAMSTTFLLSNMSPQTPKLNRSIWKKLEDQVRKLVRKDGEAWIVTGNIFMSIDSQLVTPTSFIGNNNVAIPTHCYKAILTSQENGSFSAYAFLLPNQKTRIKGQPSDYMITVDKLEQIVEIDFFPLLEDETENQIEGVIHNTWIN